MTEEAVTLLPPSTDNVYDSLQARIKAVNEHAEKHGYGIVKRRSKRNKKGAQSTVYLQCDQGVAV